MAGALETHIRKGKAKIIVSTFSFSAAFSLPGGPSALLTI